MCAHSRWLRAAITTLGLVTFACTAALGQNARLAAHVPNANPPTVPPPAPLLCSGNLFAETAVPHALATSEDSPRSNCEAPATAASVPYPARDAIDPCFPSGSSLNGCRPAVDTVPLLLQGMGKEGLKISRARERVLEILESDNACSAWFLTRAPNPSSTFRAINFELDRRGEDSVLESRDADHPVTFRNPYVAKVIQGDGANATITLNARGGFFRTSARVIGVRSEGGPFDVRGQRFLKVGPYDGDTLPAQVLTLLHEFGHALDMLPVDENDVGGKSAQNTEEALRYCRSAIESKANPGILRASQ